jgi:threonine dehydratase
MVPPFDHEWIIEGQGTCGLEILEQVADADVIVVPMGGGGLVSGVAAAVKQSGAKAKVVGVEPAGAAKMTASLAAGHPVTLERTASIADGLMPVRPATSRSHVQAFVDEVVTVTDEEIARAALWLFFEAKQVVEPSGAATVAAVMAGRGRLLADLSPRVVAILSGGNVAPETLMRLASQGSAEAVTR